MTNRDALQRLTQPNHAYSPAPIWWWSGERLDPARLRWQLEQFAAGGVYNLVILNLAPSGPLHGSLADQPAFLTQEWWDIFRGVCADARALGIRLWFYDQIGFSGANLQGTIVRREPSYAGQELASQRIDCAEAGVVLFPAGGTPLAAVQIDATGALQHLPIQGNAVQTTALGAHAVRLIYMVQRGFDYLNPAACLALRATVHEAFEREAGQYFGDVIVGSFQDEMPSMPTWSVDFASSFAAHYGYDLGERLGSLYEGDTLADQQVRIDYQRWRAQRAEAAYFKPFYDWHAERGLICGFDQQSPARMALPIGAVDEYADYMQTHSWYGAPGSDHHGNGKIHSSMAHLYQRPRSWIEAFHSSGWGGTIEETFDWLVPWLRAGLTLYNPHAVYYSTRGGWWEWAPPSTCWRQPYWQHYRVMADAVMRLTGILSLGRHVCDIAVLFPTTTVQADYRMTGPGQAGRRAEACFVAVTGSMFWNNPKPGVLDSDRRDYDMIDDASIARATLIDGQLCVAAEAYRCLILPAITHLEPSAAAAVRAFAAGGGLVITVETIPDQLRGAAGVVHVPAAIDLPAVLARIPRRIDGPVQTLERQVDGGRVVLVTPFDSASTFAWTGHWNSTPYAFDRTRLPSEIEIAIPGIRAIEQWHVTDGTRHPIAAAADGQFRLSFADAPIALLYIPDAAAPVAGGHPATERAPAARTYPLDGTWELAIEPTLDNRHGDFVRPASGLLTPQTQRFDSDSGVLTQGFGTYGWYTITAGQTTHLSALQAGADPLATVGWQPLVYSLTKGIHKDTLHWGMLGPKGYVPEEFMAFGKVRAGQTVCVRTTFVLEAAVCGALVVSAAAAKRIWLDGVLVSSESPGYAAIVPCDLQAGQHLLEFHLTPDQAMQLRGSWAVLRHPERYIRPTWMEQPDAPVASTYVTFGHSFVLAHDAPDGALMVVADVPVSVRIDGVEIGRQGGFDPYGSTVRVQPYALGPLAAGAHRIEIHALDSGRGVSLMVDGRYNGVSVPTRLLSGSGWQCIRSGGSPVAAKLRRRQWVDLTFATDPELYNDMDPGWPLIDRRPHPLPGADWLEDQPADDTVVRLTPDAFPGLERSTVLRWRIPRGATQMRIATNAASALIVDGQVVALHGGTAALPPTARTAELTLTAVGGAAGAAMLLAPIRYDYGTATVQLPADYAAQGLGDYAGAVCYTRMVTVDADCTHWLLVLADVRGTVAVAINGVAHQPRVWAPYQFDVSAVVRPGVNTIAITITNTLAPYMAAHSPTHYTSPHQEVSGIVGSITLHGW